MPLLRAETFGAEECGLCGDDIILVQEGNGQKSKTCLGEYCGYVLPMKAETFEAKEKIDLSKSALKERIREYERKYHDVSEEEVDTTYDTIQGIGLIDELKRCYKAE